MKLMKKLLLLLPFLALTSCADLLKNDFLTATPGFYKSAHPADPGASFGFIVTRPAPVVVITPEK
jgi:hypothetical protein